MVKPLFSLTFHIRVNMSRLGYFVGDNISYLDLGFVVIVKIMQEQSGADKDLVKLPASLDGLFTRVTELPAIKKYYDSNPYPLIQ